VVMLVTITAAFAAHERWAHSHRAAY